MGWPGEQLVSKMWDTLMEKGIGAIWKPNQIKREGLAALEVERARILVIAQAEREAGEIKIGSKDLSNFSAKLEFKKAGATTLPARIEPSLNHQLVYEASHERIVRDTMRQEINVAHAISHAEDALKEDPTVPPEASVEEDWLYRWRDYTGEVSNADLQKIWGRLLAGEVKSPGSYSLRCLEFLKNLSHPEMKLIEKLSSLVFHGAIWRPESEKYTLPLSFEELLELQDLGILSGVDAMGLQIQFPNPNPQLPTYSIAISCHEKCLIVKHESKESLLTIPISSVTKLGLQIVSLGEFKAEVPYLEALGESIVALGYTVSIGDFIVVGAGRIQMINEKVVTLE